MVADELDEHLRGVRDRSAGALVFPVPEGGYLHLETVDAILAGPRLRTRSRYATARVADLVEAGFELLPTLRSTSLQRGASLVR